MRRLVVLGLAGVLGTGPILGQSLGDLAARERARRKKAKASAQAFTDEDLKKVRTSTGSAAASGSATSGAVDRPESSSESTVGEGTRDGWQAQAQQLREAVAEAEKGVAAAQKDLEAARSSVGQPQQADGLRQTPVNPLIKEPAYEAAEQAVADARAAADAARAALAAFEEKARKAAVPPGWLR